jgi:hypothetical protein
VETAKKGECPEDHLGIKNRIKKIPPKNVTLKNRHIDIIAPKTGYSNMLDISYLFNNNTLKCIKAKIFPFNQK